MSDLLVAIIVALCPGTDINDKGQVVTTECQEKIVNCAVELKSLVTENSIKKCLEEYSNERN